MVDYSASPRTEEEVPVIDIAPSFGANEDAQGEVAQRIRAACRDIGFFSVKNHGVDQAIIDRAFAESQRFFSQPQKQKLRVLMQAGTNGYEPPETQILDPEAPPDLKESYNFTRPALPGTPDHMENRWPGGLPGFRETLELYQEVLRRLGLHISRLMALSLGMPFHFFDHTFENQKATVRLLRYPPMSKAGRPNQLGAGAHTDFGWITLLAQDSVGGLEIQTASGNWIGVEPVPGAFIINLGDMVVRWTNGLYHSSLHRVSNNKSGRNRYSIAFFYNHQYETPVECLPTCVNPGEVPKFERAISGELKSQRYTASRHHILGTGPR